jgi:DNA-binding transcriptional LysR family regulator
MELRQLRYFLAVADAGQLTAAAAALGIQQPPLSQQIQALERRLGLRLLRRHPKGVSLTDGGRVFEQEARRIVADALALEDRLRALARGHSGLLQVAFTSSAAAHAFTPEALRECRQRHPDIEWVVSEANAAEITEGVAAGRLHCGFLRVPVARPQGVAALTLLHEPALAALPIDHPLAAQRQLRLADLHAQPLVLVRRPGAPGLYANLLALCERHGVVPRVVAQVERMMTNLNLVAAGVGLSVVPASMQGVHPQAVAYRPLARDARLDAPLTLLYREDRNEGALRTFVDLVTALAAKARSVPARRARTPRR